MTNRRKWFKELKLEIKDKLEIIEHLTEKRVPDIVDIKGIRENEIFERIEEEWVRTVRLVAENIDIVNEELSRSFISPSERPQVGPPEPAVEEIVPRRISAAEARQAQEKHEYIRGQKVVVSKEAERLHDEVHGRNPRGAETTVAKKSGAKKTSPRRRREEDRRQEVEHEEAGAAAAPAVGVIVVAGSRHDPVATDLAEQWPDAALCSAEDLTASGWIWPSRPGDGPATWVVDGAVVPDSQVTGVFVRRATVYAEELTATHPDDRAYLAAEAHAFLVYVLHRTAATVVNPVDDGGAFGESALRPEHWMAVAASARREGGATAAAQLTATPSGRGGDARRGRRHRACRGGAPRHRAPLP